MDQIQSSQCHSDHLFCSEAGPFCVIDIPLSIAHSQHIEHEVDRYIYSAAAPDKPWPSLEPKSDKAKANLLARVDLTAKTRNKEYAALIRTGLQKIKRDYSGPWSADRLVETAAVKAIHSGSKSRADLSARQKPIVDHGVSILQILQLQGTEDAPVFSTHRLHQSLICNSSDKQNVIQCVDEGGKHTRYLIPPLSSICQRHISDASVLEFEMALEQLHAEQTETAGAGQFDVILIDPPWENRSVKRSGQYVTIVDNKDDPLDAVCQALPRLLAYEGLLAIWITNNASVRRRAFEILEEHEIEDVEEWIWLKVTTKCEPVYDLDGIYRQPWEICLVGRRRSSKVTGDHEIRQRLIAACPDLHSRKPALGRLLVSHYNATEPASLRKLEVFARYASAGWCVWGDEALKFNDEACWTTEIDAALERFDGKKMVETGASGFEAE